MRWIWYLFFVSMLCLHLHGFGQVFTNETILRNLADLNENESVDPARKLQLLYDWKKRSEALQLPQDSVYAKLLHRIGVFEFTVNKNYNAALIITLKALRINSSGKAGASETLAVTDRYNLATFYNKMKLFDKALLYYDSAIRSASLTPDVDNVAPDSRLDKAYIFFQMGDYQKAVEESDLGISFVLGKKDSLRYLFFLNQRAQSLFFQNKLLPAMADIGIAVGLAQALHESFELASAFKTRALIFAKEREFVLAEASFSQCIEERIKTRSFLRMADDYNDLGKFYSDGLKAYDKASACLLTAIQYGKKERDSVRIARALLNLGRNYFYERRFFKAAPCYQEAMRYLKIGRGSDLLENPSVAMITGIGNKALIQVLFNSKTELLLGLYKKTREDKWLKACIRTALLNDSLISEMRHEQFGEQSKLYWRERTRGFFSDAIEACYYAGDHKLGFYFLEKSRSVLLQDKLNESGASAFLPAKETADLENLQMTVADLQQQLVTLTDTSQAYPALRVKLLTAKEKLEQEIRVLESRYPRYSQHKYNEKVQSLTSLQVFLGKRRERFIEYFIQDTVNFALCVTPDTTQFIRIDYHGANMEDLLISFVRSCSDENGQNNDFHGFLVKANSLYKMLFGPFRLPGGRVIICQDNYLVPFETLSKDTAKADFLIDSYAFSYVYSARYLMNEFEDVRGKGDFLGIAPVKFGAYKGLPDLAGSVDALRNCSAFYNQSMVLMDKEASRGNFMQQMSNYKVTTILTHARADSSDAEPLLFLKDSVIHLSELQMLNSPATKLIVLSGCQTNAGRNLNGEGIFSLARGFSSAGIPSVAATQWEADDQAIYTITEKFNEYIAGGANKDEALQKAKRFYIRQDKKGSILPYYWAGMVLIGNAEPVEFSAGAGRKWLGVVVFLTVLVLFFIFYRWKRSRGTPYIR